MSFNVLGAIDGSHVPVAAPVLNHSDYFNRKGWYSVVVQAVVDHRYRFLDVYTGWPGSVHDARIFAHSTLYKKGVAGELLPSETRQLCGVTIPLFLIGDSAYPLIPWLMKPYVQSLLTTDEKKKIIDSRARIVVENAFSRLKARWQRLMKRNDMLVENVPTIIAAACILHNVCEIHNETFDESWLSLCHEDTLPQPSVGDRRAGGGDRAKEVRDGLVRHFNAH